MATSAAPRRAVSTLARALSATWAARPASRAVSTFLTPTASSSTSSSTSPASSSSASLLSHCVRALSLRASPSPIASSSSSSQLTSASTALSALYTMPSRAYTIPERFRMARRDRKAKMAEEKAAAGTVAKTIAAEAEGAAPRSSPRLRAADAPSNAKLIDELYHPDTPPARQRQLLRLFVNLQRDGALLPREATLVIAQCAHLQAWEESLQLFQGVRLQAQDKPKLADRSLFRAILASLEASRQWEAAARAAREYRARFPVVAYDARGDRIPDPEAGLTPEMAAFDYASLAVPGRASNSHARLVELVATKRAAGLKISTTLVHALVGSHAAHREDKQAITELFGLFHRNGLLPAEPPAPLAPLPLTILGLAREHSAFVVDHPLYLSMLDVAERSGQYSAGLTIALVMRHFSKSAFAALPLRKSPAACAPGGSAAENTSAARALSHDTTGAGAVDYFDLHASTFKAMFSSVSLALAEHRLRRAFAKAAAEAAAKQGAAAPLSAVDWATLSPVGATGERFAPVTLSPATNDWVVLTDLNFDGQPVPLAKSRAERLIGYLAQDCGPVLVGTPGEKAGSTVDLTVHISKEAIEAWCDQSSKALRA